MLIYTSAGLSGRDFPDGESMLKKRLMEFMWRLQASQTIIGIIFWPLTLTGIFYPYIRERTDNFGLGQESVLGGMLILFSIIVLFIVIFGLIFDKLRFWKEQNIVLIERNPYASIKLNAKEIYWMKMWSLALRANPGLSADLKKELELFDRWINYNLAEDIVLRNEVERIKMTISEEATAPDKAA
jgi:hypothetical protein